ncbi:MAG: PmoA family protein [Alphaproteobacteria bacterium]
MTRRIAISALLSAVVFSAVACSLAAEITAAKSENGAIIKIDGKLFAEYVIDSGGKPIIWPIIGPTGKPMTRAWPMAEAPGEKQDHPHHRSLWFTHGDVNGLSYWHREITKHREFVKIEGGQRATIITRNDWLDKDGKPVCEDERKLVFGADADVRWIDFDITIKAIAKQVRFGDTKEGCFGVRVPWSMKVDAKQGGKIINSEGQSDKDAWGKASAWVDYHGPVDGQTVGIAIMNHPSSFRFPTHWHVRTYGLFAANPFGLSQFEGKGHDGSHTLSAGQSMKFCYRVIFHRGDEKTAKVAEAYSAYAKEER